MLEDERSIAVHVRNASKTYQENGNVVQALKNVNLDARKGELLMIVGPSGCGKTTLLSIIAGTLKFNSGEVDVLGKSLHEMPEAEITEFRKKHVGFIFQQFHLIKTLNILENISVPLILNGVKWSDALEKAAEMLAKIGLKGREYDSPKNLSGGQQQRIAIARALVHEPQLLICDEPTSALDAETGSKILELITAIAKSSERCVIIVTHDSRIFKYADRLAKMDDGRVISLESNHRL